MKVARRSLLVIVVVLMAGATLLAQQPPASPPGEASVKFGDGKSITIKYSRPSMKGRKIYGGLVPYGQVWRTGANAATSFTTDTNLDIGGTNVPAGNYTLYTLPSENGWQLIVNKQTGQWGTEYSQGQDLGRVKMTMSKTPALVEKYKMTLSSNGSKGMLKLEWENTAASVPITVK